jgi:hypothetical protein
MMCCGDEDQAAVLVGQRLDDVRDAELRECGHILRDDAKGEAGGAALAVGVDAEAREILVLVGDVEVAGGLELGSPLGGARADRIEDGQERRLVERGGFERDEATVPAKDGWPPELEVDVARPLLDRVPEQAVQVHGSGIGCRTALL